MAPLLIGVTIIDSARLLPGWMVASVVQVMTGAVPLHAQSLPWVAMNWNDSPRSTVATVGPLTGSMLTLPMVAPMVELTPTVYLFELDPTARSGSGRNVMPTPSSH